MYLISKDKAGYQAIRIEAGDTWVFYKLSVGRTEVRIVLRLKGRRYLLYSTCELAAKYPEIDRTQLTVLCDEIIATVSERIANRQKYIEFEQICKAAECRHHRRWRDMGLIAPTTLERYHGHPIDSKTEVLAALVRVDLDGIILMDQEPPVDCEQEELPY